MKGYNGFTAKQREAGDAIIKAAISDGILIPLDRVSCAFCGQDKGIRHYHCEDYSPENILDDAIPLCWRCHMMLHSRFSHPRSWEKYKAEIDSGMRFPPVFRHDWKNLDQHMID